MFMPNNVLLSWPTLYIYISFISETGIKITNFQSHVLTFCVTLSLSLTRIILIEIRTAVDQLIVKKQLSGDLKKNPKTKPDNSIFEMTKKEKFCSFDNFAGFC